MLRTVHRNQFKMFTFCQRFKIIVHIEFQPVSSVSMSKVDAKKLPSVLEPSTRASLLAPRSAQRRLRRHVDHHGAVFLILLCNVTVGFTYNIGTNIVISDILTLRTSGPPFSTLFLIMPAWFVLLGAGLTLYPIGGLLADLCCGRYKVVAGSMLLLCCGYALVSVVAFSYAIDLKHHDEVVEYSLQGITGGIAVFLLAIGFSGFQANSVQFGLDQLQEASSRKLCMFLHWFVWTEEVGKMASRLLAALLVCITSDVELRLIFVLAPLTLLLTTVTCVVLNFWKRHWFHREPKVSSPYKTVYRVLKFASKHNAPLRRSALTYSDDIRPTRMEFAKEKYGGPFTTEEVEDVKTFLRIVIMLMIVGSVYYLTFSLDYIIYIFGVHLGNGGVPSNEGCTYQWVLLQTGNLSNFIVVITIPIYLASYSKIVKWLPRILFRLGIGVFLTVSVAICLFVIQVWANIRISQQDPPCMFLAEYRNSSGFNFSQTLEFPTESLIVPHVLKGIATPLLHITALEFISAQSPHQMKGLLLGIFYASKGLFMIVGSVLTFPFTSAAAGVWETSFETFDCGFYYYLVNAVVGVMSFVLFLCGAKWYKYRVREEEPYGPRYVEDVYDRYLTDEGHHVGRKEQILYGSCT